MYYAIRCKKHLTQADVAELVDALDLGSSIFDVRVRVSPSAFIFDVRVRVSPSAFIKKELVYYTNSFFL